MRIAYLILLVIFVSLNSYSQETASGEWQFFSSPKDDLVFSLPSGYLADIEKKKYSLFGSLNNVSMRVSLQLTGSAKDRIRELRKAPRLTEYEITSFEKDEVVGDLYKFYGKRVTSYSIYLASKNIYAYFDIRSKDADNSVIQTFLTSIMINGDSLFKKDQLAIAKPDPVTPIATLSSSPEVLEALKVGDMRDPKFTYELTSKNSGNRIEDENSGDDDADKAGNSRDYSRAIVILRRPSPSYNSSAQQASHSGNVSLRIVFRADGQIGDIVVVGADDKVFVKDSVIAAGKIKFLPGQIDGKAVDVTLTVQYTFRVY